MSTEHVTFLFGPTKAGKTTLSHALNASKLSIRKVDFRYIVQAFENSDISREIGNLGQSSTIHPSYYLNNSICDFPGFNDTRGKDQNIENLIKIYTEIQKHQKVCLGVCIEEGFITVSNASLFVNFTNDLIDLLNLCEESTPGIRIVVMKSSKGFCQDICQIFRDLLPEENNFIIEGIKKNIIKPVAFELPVAKGSEFEFSIQNIQEILTELRSNESINSMDLKKLILPRIIQMLNSVSSDNLDIVFLSRAPMINRITSTSIVCIDKDIDMIDEKLSIDAPIVIVKTDLSSNEKRVIKLTGKAPTVRFLSVNTVLNGSNLVISTNNMIRNIKFPDPIEENFDKSLEFFRIESVSVNGGWTEYASHNNKFIDLIAYINPTFGRVEVDPNWNIKVVTVDIKLKLFVNECMRTKKGIIERFKSLKAFRDVDEYLNSCKKLNFTPELRSGLEIYGINLPSIFQILMKPTLLYFFTSKANQIEDLMSIREILIERYLKLIGDYNKSKNEIRKTEQNGKGFDDFFSFLERFHANFSDFDKSSKKIKTEIMKFLQGIPSENDMAKFHSFYNALSLSEDKVELFKYNITGDISIYPNHLALLDTFNKGQLAINDFSLNYVPLGSGVGIAGIGITIGAIAGRTIAVRVATQTAIRASLAGAAIAGAAIVGAVLFAAEIGVNLIVASAKSGYFEKECCYEGILLRLDCNIPLIR